jgi:endonuclease/exonuclease/phosphatase family metal-dependent hydrolase
VPRIPIDHVVVSPEVRVTDRRVGPDVGSDHLPVEATLAIP